MADGAGKVPQWAKTLGVIIGGAIVTVATSMGTASAATADAKAEAAEAAEEAKKAAEAKATSEAARAEAAVAAYIKTQVEPAISEAFAGVDDDLDELGAQLAECRASAREATVLADTALRLIERRYGRAAVERTLGAADRAEPKPKLADKKAEHRPSFDDYEQKVVAPSMPAEGPP